MRGGGPGGDGSGGQPPSGGCGGAYGLPNASEEVGAGVGDYGEARLGDVLATIKSDDVDNLVYSTGSKPVDFEQWATMARPNLESRRSHISAW